MRASKEEEELELILEYKSIALKEGPESWQLKDFVSKNKDELGIDNVANLRNEFKPQLDDSETFGFDLVNERDDSALKAKMTTKNEPEEGKATSISAELGKITDPKEAREAISKFLDLVMKTFFRFQPGGSELKLYTGGLGKWNELCKEIEQEKCQEYAGLFKEKGIKLSIDDNPMIDKEPDNNIENDNVEKRRGGKPWDVPHGAPDARPKKQ